MHQPDPQALIETILPAVLDAGRAIMDVREAVGDIAVTRKDDKSPVTEADARAEEILIKIIKPLLPQATIVAEETVADQGMPSHVGRFFWLIDPLDGTREYIRGGPDFTVNVALVEGDATLLGIIYAPALNKLWAGAKGQGAWQAMTRQDTIIERKAIRVRAPHAGGLDVVASKSHRDPATDAFLEKISLRHFKAAGSSLKFCLLAAGEADLYPRFGPTMEWDTGAGQAILEAAGGAVFTPEGEVFRYRKTGFKNGAFIATSQDHPHW